MFRNTRHRLLTANIRLPLLCCVIITASSTALTLAATTWGAPDVQPNAIIRGEDCSGSITGFLQDPPSPSVQQLVAVPGGNWGQEIGSYRGVPARSNGVDTGDWSSNEPYGQDGYQYQCVEYIRRFYRVAMGANTSNWYGNGCDYYGNGPGWGLERYANGGGSIPQPSDILCFGSGYGHVAIVTGVADGRVYVIQQNVSSSTAYGSFSWSGSIVGSLGSHSCQGWLRRAGPPPAQWEGQLESPTNGTQVSGVVTISGWAREAGGNYPVEWVEILLNGVHQPYANYDASTGRFSCQWDTRSWAGQSVEVTARPVWRGLNWFDMKATVSVIPPAPQWQGQLETPANGAQVSGTATISGWAREAGGNYPVEWVEILLNGVHQPHATYDPSTGRFSCQWDTTSWAGQSVEVTARPVWRGLHWFDMTASVSVPSPPRRLTLTAAACGHVLVNGTVRELPWEGTFDHGSTVRIQAIPDSRWELDRWSGDVPSTSIRQNPLTLMMDRDRTVNTHFQRARRTLTIAWAAAGSAMVNGELRTLPHTEAFLLGQTVEVVPLPHPNWQFQCWSGDVPDSVKTSNPLRVVMSANRQIKPYFQREFRRLTVEWAGAGTIWVNGKWHALPYSGSFPIGDTVRLEDLPKPGWTFHSWTGDVLLSQRTRVPLLLVMDRDRTIKPNFQRLRKLTIGAAAAGSVLVNGVAQALPYERTFTPGTPISIKSMPKPGWQLDCWSGDVAATSKRADPLEFSITEDCMIQPHFSRARRTLTIESAGAGTVLVNGVQRALPHVTTFLNDEVVTIKAMPKTGWAFDAWTGHLPAGDVRSNPLRLKMNCDRTIDPHFRLASTSAQLMAVTAVPTVSGAEICFTLAAPAMVSAEVLNISGHTVKHIVTGRLSDSGPQSLVWNGYSDLGTRVPYGSYLVRVTAFREDGQRTERLTTLQIR